MNPARRDFLHQSYAILATPPLITQLDASCNAAEPPTPKSAKFDFYVMDTGLRGSDVPTLEKKVELVKKLGFVGIGYTLNHRELPQLLELLDKAKLELSAVYLTPALEGPLDPNLADSIRCMKGRKTRIELAIGSKKYKSSDPEGDKQGVELLKTVSDMASDTGPVVLGVSPYRQLDGVRRGWCPTCQAGGEKERGNALQPGPLEMGGSKESFARPTGRGTALLVRGYDQRTGWEEDCLPRSRRLRH